VITSVLRPDSTEDMDVEDYCVLIDDNNNKNESAKLIFFASMAQSRIELIGITVEENTCEEGGVRKTPPPTTLSEEPSYPQFAQGSDDDREEGTIGSHLWEVVGDTHMSVDQCRETDGAGDVEHAELGATDRGILAPTSPEVTSSKSLTGEEAYRRTPSKGYARVGTAPRAPAGTEAGEASVGRSQKSSALDINEEGIPR
jgi:hypothetical protein